MLMRIFVATIIVIAIIVGALTLFPLSRDQLIQLMVFRDFFDVGLPILAFGALIKYLCKRD